MSELGSAAEEVPAERADVVSAASGQLFGRSLLYVVVWSLSLVASVLVVPFVTRLLGVVGFGRLAAALAVGQILVVVFGLGMNAAIIRQYVDDDDDRRARGLLFVAFVLAFLLTALVYMKGPIWCGVLGFRTFSGPLRLIVLWGFPAASCQAALGLLRAQDRLRAFSSVSVLQSVGTQACGLAMVLWISRSATLYAFGLLVGQFAALLVAVVVSRPRAAGLSDGAAVRDSLAFGLPLVPQGLAVFVLSAGDRVVIQRMLGPTAVGRYQVAYSVGSLILVLMAFLNQSWEGAVLSIPDETLRAEVLSHSRDRLLRTIQPLLIAIVAGAPIALRVFAPPVFRPNELVVVSAVVALSATPYAFYMANVLRLFSARRTRPLAVACVVCAVANILMNFLLIPILGITGSALASLLAFALQAAMTEWAASRFLVTHAPSASTWAFVFAGSAAAIATVVLPKAGAGIELRVVIAAVCMGWFVAMLRASISPRHGSGSMIPEAARQ
jgi:O-antigen/teichoic acid export membrane protein